MALLLTLLVSLTRRIWCAENRKHSAGSLPMGYRGPQKSNSARDRGVDVLPAARAPAAPLLMQGEMTNPDDPRYVRFRTRNHWMSSQMRNHSRSVLCASLTELCRADVGEGKIPARVLPSCPGDRRALRSSRRSRVCEARARRTAGANTRRRRLQPCAKLRAV